MLLLSIIITSNIERRDHRLAHATSCPKHLTEYGDSYMSCLTFESEDKRCIVSGPLTHSLLAMPARKPQTIIMSSSVNSSRGEAALTPSPSPSFSLLLVPCTYTEGIHIHTLVPYLEQTDAATDSSLFVTRHSPCFATSSSGVASLETPSAVALIYFLRLLPTI